MNDNDTNIESQKSKDGGKLKILPGPKEWADIQARYESGENVRALAKKYGITHSAIANKAKRKGWGKHGSLRTVAIEGARMKVKEELQLSYEEVAKEFNEKYLSMFRNIQEAAMLILDNLAQRIEARREQNEYMKAEAIKRGDPYSPMPLDTGDDVDVYAQLVNILCKCMNEERKLLGIEGTTLLKKESHDPMDEFCKVFREATERYTCKDWENCPHKHNKNAETVH
ncbi:MAG: hypothetical protein ABSB79_09375 [Syntrophales bacterium]|jgi:hypothetical protein